MTKDALREALKPVPPTRRLAVALAAANLKQQDVADACGISKNQFSLVVRGRREPSPTEAKAIAKVIGLAASDLFAA
jgi:transcriptional regulator with XRE-family HTH domain